MTTNKKVKVIYKPSEFSEERILEKDTFAFSGSLVSLSNDSKHGDLLEFKRLAKLDDYSYLSCLALNKYFDTIGIGSGDMELKLINSEEYKTLIGEDVLASYTGMGKFYLNIRRVVF